MSTSHDEDTALSELPEHPTGTLVIVLIYAGLFVLGWLGIYLFLFVARGTPTV